MAKIKKGTSKAGRARYLVLLKKFADRRSSRFFLSLRHFIDASRKQAGPVRVKEDPFELTAGCTLNVSYNLTVDVHAIEGGGYWGEVRQLAGCVAQADTLEGLRAAITRAINDWLAEPGVQSERTARELAAIQGGGEIPDGPYPLPYAYQPPADWTEDE